MATRDENELYRVTLINEAKGSKDTIEVLGNEYILDAAEQQNVELPYSCRAGACISCTGKVLQGEVDRNDHSFLREKELKAGFVLLCAAYPMSDCVISTHQEDALLDLY
ncbi:MAG: 2Fe-2S iron-sulfur cluster binding domain-containing protein [Cyanosarcina radialis HA8281-LM2]|jgi:ferredoxin|nr:2Fe-2S iron-sulfur cluster binding domain-containing protein [Cyanosarcina radialis HA8281-LM2]